MVLRNLRITFLVITGILIVSFMVRNVILYHSKSRVAGPSICRAECIRGAFSNYAADNVDYAYPKAERIHDYASLCAFVNQNGGGFLPESEAKTPYQFVSYETQDTDNDRVPDSYLLILMAIDDTYGKLVAQLRITPKGIERVPVQGAIR